MDSHVLSPVPTWIVEPERLEPLPADGEEAAAHDGVGVRRPRVHLAGAVRRRHLVPLERHLPVHEAAQVLAAESLKIRVLNINQETQFYLLRMS